MEFSENQKSLVWEHVQQSICLAEEFDLHKIDFRQFYELNTTSNEFQPHELAAQCGQIQSFQHLVTHYAADVASKNNYPLRLAALNSQTEFVKWLIITHRDRVSLLDAGGQAIRFAIARQNVELVTFFFDTALYYRQPALLASEYLKYAYRYLRVHPIYEYLSDLACEQEAVGFVQWIETKFQSDSYQSRAALRV